MLLVRQNATLTPSDDRRLVGQAASGIELRDIFAFLRRQRVTIVAVVALCILLAIAYVLLATPRFSADAFVLVEPQKARLFQGSPAATPMVVESSLVDSQVEIARSGRVILKVINDLDLSDDPELSAVTTGLKTRLLSILTFARPVESTSSPEEPRPHLIDNFRNALTVRRLGLTQVLQISYTSRDPDKAARVANGVALAYVTDDLRAKYDDSKLARGWLEERVGALRAQALEAERAAQHFRTVHSIVNTGRGLVDEQQLNELNSQLVLMQAHTAEARARLAQIEGIIRRRDAEAVVTDALRNEVINRLRSRLLDAARTEADLTRRFGPEHGAAVKLREEVEGLQRSIFDELNRIAEGYRSDYEVAKSRESSLEASLNELVQRNVAANETQITLHQLERDARASSSVYEAFLTRLKEAAQQQSFPITEARIITAAERPSTKSHPRTTLILGGALCVGVLGGLGAGLMRERLDRTFRTVQQVERETGINCLGVVPQAVRTATGRPPGGSILSHVLDLQRSTTDTPLSTYAKAFRSIKLSLDAARSDCKARVVGVLSTLPNEGTTTIASTLAQVAAMGGQNVLLIDADVRKCPLGSATVNPREAGLYDVILERRRLADVVRRDPKTGLAKLAVGSQIPTNAGDILGSPAMRKLLEHMSDGYDLILLDLPALAATVDARALAPSVDAFLLVIAWGQTSRHVVLSALSSAEIVYQRMLGCILNKVDMRAMQNFDRDGSGYQLDFR